MQLFVILGQLATMYQKQEFDMKVLKVSTHAKYTAIELGQSDCRKISAAFYIL